jgi:hypothetical protein
MQIAAGGAAAADKVSTDFEKPVTLTWKVTGAKSAQLEAASKPTQITSPAGTTDKDGHLRLEVSLASGLTTTLKMEEGGKTIAIWEFELVLPPTADAPPPKLAGNPPTVACASLLSQPLSLPLDKAGNGQGTIVIDPGPRESADFTLTIAPIDGSSVQPVKVSASVTNFFADLVMADGKKAPPGKKCTLALGALAGGAASRGQGGSTPLV